MPEYETHNGLPVNPIDRRDGVQYVIEECVICGETHHHGAANPTEIGKPSHRGAHCSELVDGGYYIVLTEDTTGL